MGFKSVRHALANRLTGLAWRSWPHGPRRAGSAHRVVAGSANRYCIRPSAVTGCHRNRRVVGLSPVE